MMWIKFQNAHSISNLPCLIDFCLINFSLNLLFYFKFFKDEMSFFTRGADNMEMKVGANYQRIILGPVGILRLCLCSQHDYYTCNIIIAALRSHQPVSQKYNTPIGGKQGISVDSLGHAAISFLLYISLKFYTVLFLFSFFLFSFLLFIIIIIFIVHCSLFRGGDLQKYRM